MKRFKVQSTSESYLTIKPDYGSSLEMFGLREGEALVLSEDSVSQYSNCLNIFTKGGKLLVSEDTGEELPVEETLTNSLEGGESAVLPSEKEKEVELIKDKIKDLTAEFKDSRSHNGKVRIKEEISELKKKIGSLK